MRHKIPAIIDTPEFLKFVKVYMQKFKDEKGFGGRWLYEYKDMETRGLFKPNIIKALYKKILLGTCHLGYIREHAIYYIGIYAQDAAEAYIDEHINALYDIRVITGELAYDDDDDPYTDLTYEEATQIVKALNEEAEEELFVMKRKY